MKDLKMSEKKRIVLYNRDYQNHEDFVYKINAELLQNNVSQECYRDQLVSYFQMAPMIQKTVPIEEADYIVYGHPYARIEDFSWDVLSDLEIINKSRKEGSEIIIVGKACNIRSQIEGKYDNITYVDKHYTEYLGKRFGIDMKDEYFVYDDERDCISMWPVDGCLNKCGFCRRTYMHIPFESLSLDYIKERLDWFKETHPEQMKHISLRAENLTEYGLDIYGEQRLHELIDLLNSYDEIECIEIPIGMCIGEITPEILESICNCDKIIDISLNLEAGSDRLLKVIGKGHTREHALNIYKAIREAHPNIFLESTVMIGLPTEEIIDVYELADLIEECDLDFVHCNYYGHDPKFPLNKYPQLDLGVKKLHMSYLVKRLKKNHKCGRILEMGHEMVVDESKRSIIRKRREIAELQKYHLPKLLAPYTYENFIGFDVSVREVKTFAFRQKSHEEQEKAIIKLAYQKRLSRLDQRRRNNATNKK